ncbi:MAG: IclR family transcriptional regulator [Rhizobium sp.]|nr:IclR family transcriptional regulator [Rhizobium sp.]
MAQQTPQHKLVPAVEKASQVLDIVAAAKRYPTISELARETALPKSTVHGLCTTLVHLGLLIRRPDQTYLLGPHILKWSNAFDRQTDVATEFAALWDQVDMFPDAIASLGIPDGTDIVFIAARQTHAIERFAIRPGMRIAAPYCAAGKAVLASLSDFEISRAVGASLPPPLTEHSVGDVAALLVEIGQIRDAGVSVEAGQCQAGITNFAAAVSNSLGRPVAAIMLSVESETLGADAQGRLEVLVAEMAARLSRRLGAETEG